MLQVHIYRQHVRVKREHHRQDDGEVGGCVDMNTM